MATNVQKSNQWCNLCRADKRQSDHHISKCPVYVTGKEKCDKLRQLKHCLKCSFSNHETSKCRYQFKHKCRGCDGDHFTYLCWKKSSFNNTNANKITIEENINGDTTVSTCIATYNTSIKNCQILPTFTTQVVLGDKTTVPFTVFKDGGSQSSFICTAVADFHNFPVVRRNVMIDISGFNSSKRISTKIVKIPLLFGDKTYYHDVICVDEIRTQFCIDGIGQVVSTFLDKGYKIADNTYDKTSAGVYKNIDLVLGTDADHMLPLHYFTFGDPNNIDKNASYIDTPLGVIFSGNIEKMLKCLQFLPSKIIKTCVNSTIATYPYLGTILDPSPVLELEADEPLFSLMEVNVNACESDVLCDDNDFFYSATLPEPISEQIDDNLDVICKETLGVSDDYDIETETDTNMQLVDYVLSNAEYDSQNFLKMPLLWNSRNSHLLAKNYHLAKRLLKSNYDKLSKDPIKLRMYDDVFKQQEELGII